MSNTMLTGFSVKEGGVIVMKPCTVKEMLKDEQVSLMLKNGYKIKMIVLSKGGW